jgi:hypothetical protein
VKKVQMSKKKNVVDNDIERQIGLAERLADEVLESADKYRRFLQQLKRISPGTEKYFDLLAELSVESQVLKTKASHAEEELDRLMDGLE